MKIRILAETTVGREGPNLAYGKESFVVVGQFGKTPTREGVTMAMMDGES